MGGLSFRFFSKLSTLTLPFNFESLRPKFHLLPPKIVPLAGAFPNFGGLSSIKQSIGTYKTAKFTRKEQTSTRRHRQLYFTYFHFLSHRYPEVKQWTWPCISTKFLYKNYEILFLATIMSFAYFCKTVLKNFHFNWKKSHSATCTLNAKICPMSIGRFHILEHTNSSPVILRVQKREFSPIVLVNKTMRHTFTAFRHWNWSDFFFFFFWCVCVCVCVYKKRENSLHTSFSTRAVELEGCYVLRSPKSVNKGQL
jgi:hypothetical protein